MSTQYPTDQQRAEFEVHVQEDLSKTSRHLLRDVHEELENPNRGPGENVVHGWKRMASLFVRMGEQFEVSQGHVIRLTYIVTFVAILQIVLQVFPGFRTDLSRFAANTVTGNSLVVLGLLASAVAAFFLWRGSEDLPWQIQSWSGQSERELAFRRQRLRFARTGFILLGLGFLVQLIAHFL